MTMKGCQLRCGSDGMTTVCGSGCAWKDGNDEVYCSGWMKMMGEIGNDKYNGVLVVC